MKTIQIESDYAFRWRLVGLDAWNQVSAGAIVDIDIEDGAAIELSSTVDNGTIKLRGSVGEVNILASKITNLVASFTGIKEMSKLEINSESEVVDEERMINKTRITEDLYIRFTSENKNTRYYFADVEGVGRELSLNDKDGYSRLNLVSLQIEDSFPIHDDIKEISSEELDLRRIISIDSLDGSPISALGKFGVKSRDGRISPSLYKEVFPDPIDETKTVEMSCNVNDTGEYVFRDECDNVVFDAKDDNHVLEMDLFANSVDHVFRDESQAQEYSSPDETKTFEIDLSANINILIDHINRDEQEYVVFDAVDDTKTFEIDLSTKNLMDHINRDEQESIAFEAADETKTFEIDLSTNNLTDYIINRDELEYIVFDAVDETKTLEIDLGIKDTQDTVYRDEFDDSSVFNDTSDTINYTLEIDLYAQGALTDVDGVPFSAENPMDLTQLPA